jgi:alkylhydroperoxidase family enzyme
MAHIAVSEDLPGIRALLAFRPETAGPLGALADALLHAPGTLPQGERELIATYVSALNDCTFCHTVTPRSPPVS